jgi:hypothetical protein
MVRFVCIIYSFFSHPKESELTPYLNRFFQPVDDTDVSIVIIAGCLHKSKWRASGG